MNKHTYPSISEDNGLATLRDHDDHIYSVGISTGGAAEMRMAAASPLRRIIATTIDKEGAKFAQKQIEDAGLFNQIEVKVEDVAAPLSYPNECFDFVYARLVLHYLPRNSLIQALGELYRVMKPGGRLFVVVRSTGCDEARGKNSIFDPETGMTTYTESGNSYSRYFHTAESIQDFLTSCSFHIEHVKTYREHLCIDFHRAKLSEQIDPLIEVLASRPIQ